MDDLVLAQDVDLEVETDVGNVYMDIEQGVDLVHNLTVNCLSNVGIVNSNISLQGDVGADITSCADVGSVDVDDAGLSGLDTHLTSDSFPDQSNLVVFLESDVGSINIEADWSG
jgi:hypothetical protein